MRIDVPLAGRATLKAIDALEISMIKYPGLRMLRHDDVK